MADHCSLSSFEAVVLLRVGLVVSVVLVYLFYLVYLENYLSSHVFFLLVYPFWGL